MTCYNSENFKNYYPPTRFKGIPIAFDTKSIPANLGDSVSYPPKLGMYTNKIVKYEADSSVYIYDSFGVFSLLKEPDV